MQPQLAIANPQPAPQPEVSRKRKLQQKAAEAKQRTAQRHRSNHAAAAAKQRADSRKHSQLPATHIPPASSHEGAPALPPGHEQSEQIKVTARGGRGTVKLCRDCNLPMKGTHGKDQKCPFVLRDQDNQPIVDASRCP